MSRILVVGDVSPGLALALDTSLPSGVIVALDEATESDPFDLIDSIVIHPHEIRASMDCHVMIDKEPSYIKSFGSPSGRGDRSRKGRNRRRY